MAVRMMMAVRMSYLHRNFLVSHLQEAAVWCWGDVDLRPHQDEVRRLSLATEGRCGQQYGGNTRA